MVVWSLGVGEPGTLGMVGGSDLGGDARRWRMVVGSLERKTGRLGVTVESLWGLGTTLRSQYSVVVFLQGVQGFRSNGYHYWLLLCFHCAQPLVLKYR